LFYHEIVNSGQYAKNIMEPFFEQLTDERQCGYFQQAIAAAHIV
jgi:hypothetical protein